MNAIVRVLLVAIVAALGLAACDDAGPVPTGQPATLAGTAWRVISVNGQGPVAGSEPTAVFEAARVSGSAGCNQYGGSYQYDAASGAIALKDLGMTAMACLEQRRNDFEGIFFSAINKVTNASLDPEGRLVLTGPGDRIVLVAAPASS
jgi:heat shock protein HslJ